MTQNLNDLATDIGHYLKVIGNETKGKGQPLLSANGAYNNNYHELADKLKELKHENQEIFDTLYLQVVEGYSPGVHESEIELVKQQKDVTDKISPLVEGYIKFFKDEELNEHNIETYKLYNPFTFKHLNIQNPSFQNEFYTAFTKANIKPIIYVENALNRIELKHDRPRNMYDKDYELK